MTDRIQTIPDDTLARLAGGATDPKPKRNYGISLPREIGLFLAHLAFYPLGFFALIPEASVMHLGADYSWPAMAAFLLCVYLVGYTKVNMEGFQPRFLHWGPILLIVGFILAVPIFFGFLIFGFISIAMGGLAGFMLVWKGLALCAFAWWYIS